MVLSSGVKWAELVKPGTPVLEIIVRGSVMYLSLFFLLRLILKRQAGTISISDLLLLVLIADAAQNGMAGQYNSITDGILLVAVLIFWNFALDWLSFRFAPLARIVHPPPLLLVKEGRLVWENLRREFITRDQIMTQLREQGIDDLKRVKAAYIEGDGRISVVQKEEHVHGTRERKAT